MKPLLFLSPQESNIKYYMYIKYACQKYGNDIWSQTNIPSKAINVKQMFTLFIFIYFFTSQPRSRSNSLPLCLSQVALSLIVNKFSPILCFSFSSSLHPVHRRGEAISRWKKDKQTTNERGWVTCSLTLGSFRSRFFHRFNCERHFYCFALILYDTYRL